LSVTTTPRGGSGGQDAAAATATQIRTARSVVVACTCLATHLLIAATSTKSFVLALSPIQASSLVTLIVCGWNAPSLPPATAAAALCGTFAGMSAHIASSVATAAASGGGRSMYYGCYAAALLGYSALAGLAYCLFEVYQIGVGVGGRLGCMALCGNAAFTALFARSTLQSTLQQMVTSKTLSTTWPWLMAASSGAIAMARRWKASSSPDNSSVSTLLELMSKLAVASLILVRLLGSPLDHTVIYPFGATLVAALSACTIVQRSPGTVVPTALVGLIGSTLFQPCVSALLGKSSLPPLDVAAPLYMGAILGMTAPSLKFTKVQFGQAAMLATSLLQLSLWSGYGGRLGLFAAVGVYFARN
jgi:hypothetical protein